MHAFLMILQLWAAAALALTPPADRPPFAAERTVFGGEVLTLAQTAERGAVFIQFVSGGRSQVCTGTLIRPNAAVTAAHCWKLSGADYRAVTVYIAVEGGHAAHRVRAGHPHPGYAPPATGGGDFGAAHDVGFVIFEGRAPASYRPQALLRDASLIAEEADIELIGGGVNSETRSIDHSVRRAALKITGLSDAWFVAESGRGGACLGDSGGAAMIATAAGPYLAGVTAASAHPDCSAARWTIFAAVPPVAEWLESERERAQERLDEEEDRELRERMDELARRLR